MIKTKAYPSAQDLAAEILDTQLKTGKRVAILSRTNGEIKAIFKEIEALSPGTAKICHRDHDPYAGPTWRKLYNACRFMLNPDCDWVAHELLGSIGELQAYADQTSWETNKASAPQWAHEILKEAEHTKVSRLVELMSLGLEDGRKEYLDLTITDFVAWYVKRSMEDDLIDADDAPKILLMTIHGSKGLEFEDVYVINLDSIADDNLRYVAITRAMDTLHLANGLEDITPFWARKGAL